MDQGSQIHASYATQTIMCDWCSGSGCEECLVDPVLTGDCCSYLILLFLLKRSYTFGASGW